MWSDKGTGDARESLKLALCHFKFGFNFVQDHYNYIQSHYRSTFDVQLQTSSDTLMIIQFRALNSSSTDRIPSRIYELNVNRIPASSRNIRTDPMAMKPKLFAPNTSFSAWATEYLHAAHAFVNQV